MLPLRDLQMMAGSTRSWYQVETRSYTGNGSAIASRCVVRASFCSSQQNM
ncbi:hypothetical protein SMICM304S_02472 [Streptomyces microflavus]